MLQFARMTRRNLISDSPLIEETLALLRDNDGPLPATEIADLVLRISALDMSLAAPLVGALIDTDPRLRLLKNGYVQLVEQDTTPQKLTETDFVVVDVETTGAKCPPSRLTEIGAYRVRAGRIIDEWQTLLNPQMPIPPFIVELTNITDEMVSDKPTFPEVVPQFLDFIGDAVLVAHNARFDVGFLNYEIGRVYPGRRLANDNLCTVNLMRRVFPGLYNYKLHTVAEHFSITIKNRHRAADDAHATAMIFLHALERMQIHGVQHLADARRFTLHAHYGG